MLNFPVKWVNAVAHATLPQGGNHWCFYLHIDDNHVVCVDITPSYSVPSVTKPGGSKAIMVISNQPDELPEMPSNHLLPSGLHSATKIVRLDVRVGAKVHDFVNLVVNEKRHQYEFTAEGWGCRYWTDHQITLFQSSGLLVNGSQVSEAKNAILLSYPDHVEYPLVVGSYYP